MSASGSNLTESSNDTIIDTTFSLELLFTASLRQNLPWRDYTQPVYCLQANHKEEITWQKAVFDHLPIMPRLHLLLTRFLPSVLVPKQLL